MNLFHQPENDNAPFPYGPFYDRGIEVEMHYEAGVSEDEAATPYLDISINPGVDGPKEKKTARINISDWQGLRRINMTEWKGVGLFGETGVGYISILSASSVDEEQDLFRLEGSFSLESGGDALVVFEEPASDGTEANFARSAPVLYAFTFDATNRELVGSIKRNIPSGVENRPYRFSSRMGVYVQFDEFGAPISYEPAIFAPWSISASAYAGRSSENFEYGGTEEDVLTGAVNITNSFEFSGPGSRQNLPKYAPYQLSDSTFVLETYPHPQSAGVFYDDFYDPEGENRSQQIIAVGDDMLYTVYLLSAFDVPLTPETRATIRIVCRNIGGQGSGDSESGLLAPYEAEFTLEDAPPQAVDSASIELLQLFYNGTALYCTNAGLLDLYTQKEYSGWYDPIAPHFTLVIPYTSTTFFTNGDTIPDNGTTDKMVLCNADGEWSYEPLPEETVIEGDMSVVVETGEDPETGEKTTTISLENDEAEPDPNMVYGTDETGAKGWVPARALPDGEIEGSTLYHTKPEEEDGEWIANVILLWLATAGQGLGQLQMDLSDSAYDLDWDGDMPGFALKLPGGSKAGLFANLETGGGPRLDMGFGGANGGNFELYGSTGDRAGQFRVIYGPTGYVSFTNFRGETTWKTTAGITKDGRFFCGFNDTGFPGSDDATGTYEEPTHPLQVHNEAENDSQMVAGITKEGRGFFGAVGDPDTAPEHPVTVYNEDDNTEVAHISKDGEVSAKKAVIADTDGTHEHTVTLEPSAVAFSDSEDATAQSIQLREMVVPYMDSGTVKAKLAQVLCGEPYGDEIPIGGRGADPSSPTVLGQDSEGSSDDAVTTSYDGASGTSGVSIWVVSRIRYDHTAGTPKLYAYMSKLTFPASIAPTVTGQTRVEIDTPEY